MYRYTTNKDKLSLAIDLMFSLLFNEANRINVFEGMFLNDGRNGGNRIHNLPLRRRLLYPVELRPGFITLNNIAYFYTQVFKNKGYYSYFFFCLVLIIS